MQPVRDRLTYLIGDVRERTGIVGPLKRMERSGHPMLKNFRYKKGTTTAAEEVAVTGQAEVAEVVPAILTQEDETEFSQAEVLQKQEIAATGVTVPQHVGTHTNWQNQSAEVWYYPEEGLYGVIVPFNKALNTGPKYRSLTDAVAYARGAVGMS